MINLIIWGILIYFIYKTIKYMTGLVSTPDERKNDHINVPPNKSRFNIDQKDIIEAKFEEIKPVEAEKNNDPGQNQSSEKEKPKTE